MLYLCISITKWGLFQIFTLQKGLHHDLLGQVNLATIPLHCVLHCARTILTLVNILHLYISTDKNHDRFDNVNRDS